ncbi:MAG: ABC transporter permease [Flavobacteriales bacterium]|nr:ABC transporter permease [Flavobacteriales bacterium]
MIKSWLKIAWYYYHKKALYTFINVLGLSLGIITLLVVLLYWNHENKYEKWNPNKENIYYVEHSWRMDGEDRETPTSPAPQGFTAKEKFSEVEDFTYLESGYFDAVLEYKSKKIWGTSMCGVSSNFFDFFPFKEVEGNLKKSIEGFGTMAISTDLAKEVFGDEKAVGKSIKMHKNTFVIAAVYELPKYSFLKHRAVVKSGFIDESNNEHNWGNFNYFLFYKLKENSNVGVFQKKLENLMYENTNVRWAKKEGIKLEEFDKKFGKTGVFLTNLSDVKLHSKSHGGPYGTKTNYMYLVVMFGIAILLLLLTCSNTINLLVVSASDRGKEVGVRKTFGAYKSAIVKQHFLEVLILSFFSLSVALGITELLLPLINRYLEVDLSIYNQGILGIILIVFVVTALFSGIIPSIYISNYQSIKVLKGNLARTQFGTWLRTFILGFQFIISALFIVLAILIHQQVDFMMHKDVGFDGNQVLSVYYKSRQEGVNEKKLHEKSKFYLSKIKGVETITTSIITPNSIKASHGIQYKLKSTVAYSDAVDYNYFETLKIPILQGRNFNSKISTDTIDKIIVNEALVKELNIKNPIGEKIDPGFSEEKFEIIGVVKDYHVQGFETKISPVIYVPYNTSTWLWNNLNNVQIKIKTENIEQTLQEIESVWKKEIEPGYPYDATFLDKAFATSFERTEKIQVLFTILTIFVLLISVLGLFAMTNYSIQSKFKEISIRLALGENPQTLIISLMKKYVYLIFSILVISLPLVWILCKKFLEQYSYTIDNLWIIVSVGYLILVVLMLVVIYFNLYKATKVDVVNYLKYE